MRMIAVLIALSVVSACGADGPPIRPAVTTTVGVGSSGTHALTHVTASRGKWSVGVGVGL